MRWIAYAAASFAVLRPGVSPFMLLIALACWMLMAHELAHALFPQIFTEQPLHVFLTGGRMGRRIESNAILPWMSVEEMSRCERAFSESGSSLDAALFLLSTLRAMTGGRPHGGEGRHHITAAELCAAIPRHASALAGDNARASALLASLGLRRGEDVGNVVMTLIDVGWMPRREGETLEDFRGLAIDVGPA